jgi:two-component system, cell cycle response regulator DivK
MDTKILYIDNDIASYILVSEILEGCNVEIFHSRCGLHAIQFFRQYPFIDLVVTELKVPGMGGFEIMKEIRKINTNIPVIAQTAHVINNMKCACLTAGFNEFISKPIDLNDFISILSKYFHKTQVMELESL